MIRNIKDKIFVALSFVVLVSLLFIFISILGSSLFLGWPRLSSISFYINSSSPFPAESGLLPSIAGSVITILLGSFISMPLGISTAIFLEEYRSSSILYKIIDISSLSLSSIPMVIFGVFTAAIFADKFNLGFSILTASIMLGLIMLPVTIMNTREAIRATPNYIREASYALGATKAQTICYQVLRSASPGILTGIIIAFTRAVGEAAPMIIIGAVGYISFTPPNPLTHGVYNFLYSRFTTIPAQIFIWLGKPDVGFRTNAIAAVFVIVSLIFIINSISMYLRYIMNKKIKLH